MNALLIYISVPFIIQPAMAQKSMEAVFSLPDSVETFNLDEFYSIILKNHPVVQQAGLLSVMAQQEVRLARGGFDPKLNLSLDRKEFQDKTYYDRLDGYVSFPTWFPINPKVGMGKNTGSFLDASETIPGERQYYAGIAVPLGRGLFTDERRTAVKQAQLFQTMAEAEQVKLINKILLEAAKDYWHWYHAYYNYRLLVQATDIADEIFRRVKLDQSFGEAAPVDTIQAKITLQSRLIDRQESLMQFQNTGTQLSNYLWDEAGTPLLLSLRVAPVLNAEDYTILDIQTVEELAELAKANHPDLIKLRTKINQLEVDNQLAREFLKPRLDLNYAVLSSPDPIQFNVQNDYKFGLDFSIPVFLRKERSKLALTKLKIKETQFVQSQTEREIINEINITFNQMINTNVISVQLREMVDLYDRILTAELLNLENGESDLFKINIQQEKLIQSQSKYLKMTSEYQKMKASLFWSAGVRNLNFN